MILLEETLEQVRTYVGHNYVGYNDMYRRIRQNAYSAIYKFCKANNISYQFVSCGTLKNNEIFFEVNGVKYFGNTSS